MCVCVCRVQGAPGRHLLQVAVAKLEQVGETKRSQMRPTEQCCIASPPLQQLLQCWDHEAQGRTGSIWIRVSSSILDAPAVERTPRKGSSSSRRLLYQAESQLSWRHQGGRTAGNLSVRCKGSRPPDISR